MRDILVTDTLFVHREHEHMLRAAGYGVVRVPRPDIAEDELVKAVRGKLGYILGGTEQVTARVLDAATSLRAIVFCGSDYKAFIPAWKHAAKLKIAIANAPDCHTNSVAEWAQAAALAMNRGFFETSTPAITPGIEGQTIGLVGLGRIGARIAELMAPHCPKNIFYYSAHRHPDQEKRLNLKYMSMNQVLAQSDVIFLAVSGTVGSGFFGQQHLATMKSNALLVSFMIPGTVNNDALLEALQARKLRAISDYPMDSRFDDLPPSRWQCNSFSNAFSSQAGLKEASDAVVRSLLNILESGEDSFRC